MKKKEYIVSCVIFFFLSGYQSLYSLVGGKSPVLYLEETSSPTNTSLGYAGYSSDIGQVWNNPAYLQEILRNNTIGGVWISEPSGLHENFFMMGVSTPTKYGNFYFANNLLVNSAMEKYNIIGAFEQTYNSYELIAGPSHSWKIMNKLYMGESLKLIYLNYYYVSSFAASLDLSFYYRILEYMQIGISFDNLLASRLNFGSVAEPLAPLIKIAPQFSFLHGRAKLFYNLDIYLPLYEKLSHFDEIVDNKIGLELDLYKHLFLLRTGYDGDNFTLGFGTQFSNWNLSFSYVPRIYDNLVSFGINYQLNPTGKLRLRSGNGEEVTDSELIDFYEGVNKYNNGNYREAYDDFNRVLEVNPDHKLAQKFKERAMLHLKSEDWLDSEQERLIKMHKEMAQKNESLGNYGESIFEWRKVIEINPGDIEADKNIRRIKNMVYGKVLANHKRGLDAYGKNDKVGAIEGFNAALSLDPEYDPSIEMLQKIKDELSDEESSERARIENLQKAEVAYNRGLSYYSRKSFEEAIQSFDETLVLNPEHLEAQKYKKMSEEEWERLKLGARALDEADKIYERGMLNFDNEKYFESIGDFKKALRLYPSHLKAAASLKEAQEKLVLMIKPYLLEGENSYNARKFSKALESFTLVLNFDPENEDAKNFLKKINVEKEAIIKLHMQQGVENFNNGKKTGEIKSFSQSIGHFDEVLKLDPKNKEAGKYLKEAQAKVESVVKVIHNKALSDFKENKFEEALNGWNQVINIDPANALALEYVKEVRKKIDSTKNNQLIEEWLKKGEDLLKNRDFDRALVYVNKILNVNSQDREALALKKKVDEGKARELNAEKVSKLFIEGVRDYKKRNYEDAIEKWKEVKSIDPENSLVDRYIPKAVEAQKNRKKIDFINGKQYYDQGKWLLAVTSFERALNENPGNKEARKMLDETNDRIEEDKIEFEKSGDNKLKTGDYNGAAGEYTRAIRMKKSDELIIKKENALKAQILFEQGLKHFNTESEIGLSIDPFLKVLEINPYDKKARDYINQAKDKGKKLIQEWIKQAEAAEKNKNFLQANSLYTSIIEIDQGNKDALIGRSRVKDALREMAQKPYKDGKEALSLKNYSLAIDKFKDVLEIVPDYEDTAKLLSESRDKLQKAKNEASQGSKSSGVASEKENDIINQGIVLYRQGKYKEAIAIWEEIPKSSGGYSKAQKYIARAKLKL